MQTNLLISCREQGSSDKVDQQTAWAIKRALLAHDSARSELDQQGRKLLTMNKLIILLLAVCLVSVHAFVRREAPAGETHPDIFEDTKKKIEEGWKDFSEKVNPDTIKEGLNKALETINKAISDLKPAEAPKA